MNGKESGRVLKSAATAIAAVAAIAGVAIAIAVAVGGASSWVDAKIERSEKHILQVINPQLKAHTEALARIEGRLK